MSGTVKLLVCCHQPVRLPWDDVLTPVFVGHALYRGELPEDFARAAFFDDDGENISAKNPSYNELTAVYWAWKNYEKLGDPDYVGFMHYRRHLVFDERVPREVIPFSSVDETYETEIAYPDGLFSLLERYDFLYCNGRVRNVRRQFVENHDARDLDLAVRVLKKRFPAYAGAARRFLRGNEGCFCNCFVFPKRLFFSYCRFLFSVLEGYERAKGARNGRLFVSERLTGIFVRRLQERGYRGAPLSTTLIRPAGRITICVPYERERAFLSMVTATSFLEKASGDDYYEIVFLQKASAFSVGGADGLRRRYPRHAVRVSCVEEGLRQVGLTEKLNDARLYPFLLGVLLGDRDRVLYAEAGAIALRDVSDLYASFYTDESVAFVGKGGALTGGVFCENAAALRERNYVCVLRKKIEKGIPIEEIRESILKNEVRYLPSWRVKVCDGTEEAGGAQILYFPRPAGRFASAFADAAARVPAGTDPRTATFSLSPSSAGARVKKRSVPIRVLSYVKRNGLRRTLARVKREILKRV